MSYGPGLFAHLPEWQMADRRYDRIDLHPTRFPGASRRRRRSR
jgi:hypothetical protein